MQMNHVDGKNCHPVTCPNMYVAHTLTLMTAVCCIEGGGWSWCSDGRLFSQEDVKVNALNRVCAFQVLSSLVFSLCARWERTEGGGRREEGETGVSEGFMGVIMESQWQGH